MIIVEGMGVETYDFEVGLESIVGIVAVNSGGFLTHFVEKVGESVSFAESGERHEEVPLGLISANLSRSHCYEQDRDKKDFHRWIIY